MTTFPALVPSSRTFTPGEYPNTAFRSWNGRENRARHSNVMRSSQLSLSFLALPESDLLAILAHYEDRFGEFLPFAIPSQLLSGVSAAADYTLANYQWRYVEPPTVEDIPCTSRHNVEVTLESVSPEPVTVLGLDL